MRRRLGSFLLVTALALLSGGVALALVSGVTGGGAGSPTVSLDQLRAAISQFAAVNGEPSPTMMRAVRTTRASALRATAAGDTVPGDEGHDVFVITAEGHFVGNAAHPPRGLPLPTGTELSMVVDAHSGDVLDWGLTPTPADLTPLGRPIPLGP